MRIRIRLWLTTAATTASLVGLELALGAAARSRVQLVLAPGPASADEALGAVAAVLAVALGGWVLLGGVCAVLAHAPGRLGQQAERVAASWAPLLTRHVAAALVGATVGAALGPATAVAQEAAPFPGFSATSPVTTTRGPAATRADADTPAPTASTPTPDVPAAGWVPTRPAQRPVVGPDLIASRVARADTAEVVVHRGDTLWGLVAAHLGPDATDAEVAQAWPRWYDANRAVIGPDPDHLLPGQVLCVPRATTTGTVSR